MRGDRHKQPPQPGPQRTAEARAHLWSAAGAVGAGAMMHVGIELMAAPAGVGKTTVHAFRVFV
jgi:hypothetical protein